MPRPVLSYAALRAALVARLMEGDTISEGRDRYVGASEVGKCPRAVSWAKATGRVWEPDADSAGVMQPGRLVENEGVQLLRRIGLDPALTNTGRNQARFQDGYLVCHSDGLLADDAFELDPGSTYYDEDGSPWAQDELAALLVGPGVVEFKSASSGVFRHTIRRGVALDYQDQTQANMGLSGRRWTLLVFICRDNLSKIALFFIPFRDARFQALKLHADAIMGSAALAREALQMAGIAGKDPEDLEVVATCSLHLLPPDESRGYCIKCPIASSCPALTKVRGTAYFPERVMDEVEALAEIVAESGDAEKAAKEEADSAKSRLRELAEQYGATRAILPPPFTSLTVTTQNGKPGCDFDRLKTLFPAAYADCVSFGEDFTVVRVNRKKSKGGR